MGYCPVPKTPLTRPWLHLSVAVKNSCVCVCVVAGMLHSLVGFLFDIVCCRYKIGRYSEPPNPPFSEQIDVAQLTHFDDDEINTMAATSGVAFIPDTQDVSSL